MTTSEKEEMRGMREREGGERERGVRGKECTR